MHKRVVVVVLLCLAVLAIVPSGAPIRLSYVYSDSMEPTLDTGEGYVIVATDDVEVGDVATFRSPERDEYVTHRVVGRSEQGYLTKGDNNPTTDQAAGYAHVRREQFVGRVLTVGGSPLTIPHLGALVAFLRGHWLALLALGGLGAAVHERRRASHRPSRNVVRVRDVLLPTYAVGIAAAVSFVVLGAQVQQVAFVVVDRPTEASTLLTVGEPREVSFAVGRSPLPFARSVVDADGMTVTNVSRNASTLDVTARVPPPESTGVHRTRLAVYQYPAVLPAALLRRLHAIHPVVAATAAVGVATSPLTVAYALLFDGRTPIRPVRLPAPLRRRLRP